jgi:hypothetical protein
MSDPASSFGCCVNLRENRAGMFEKRSPCRRQVDAASAARQESRAYLVLEVSNLPAERRLRCVQLSRCRHS